MTLARTALAAIALSGAMLCPIAPAFAQDAATNAKCFIVSNAFAKMAKDDKAKQAATDVRWFYLGRLAGTAAQIEANFAKQTEALDPKSSGAVMEECARAVAQKAIEIQTIGQKLAKTHGR